MSKRSVSIETLVRWAYCDELPKAGAGGGRFGPAGAGGSWGAVAVAGAMMAETVSDGRPNTFGVLPLMDGSDEPPHSDAVRIGQAVNDLARAVFTLPEGWQPFGDMDLGADAGRLASEARDVIIGLPGLAPALTIEPARLIVKHAILGGAPDWQGEPIVRGFERHDNGQPKWFRKEQRQDGLGGWFEIETSNGFDRRRQRPYPDAYRKTVFSPSPVGLARARAEYQVWVTALDYLAAVLAGALEVFEPMECGRSPAPWLEAAVKPPRILPAIAY